MRTKMSVLKNHFELFDLPVSFDIDTNTLAERYRELQRTVHPDKFASAPNRERRLAMQKATQINEAFQILKKPLTRAAYLLQLHGIDTNQQNTTMDSEFLMTQMELREELAERSFEDLISEYQDLDPEGAAKQVEVVGA